MKRLFVRSVLAALLVLPLVSACAPSSVERECVAWINSCSPDIDTSWAEPITAEGLPNLFKVSPDIYRSAQPTKGGFKSAEALGIKTVVSLRQSERDQALNSADGTSLNLIHVPLVTSRISDENIIEVMKILRDAPRPILIHCRHGADRTGLMSAMYRLIYQNWDKSCAKEELLNGGFGFHTMWRNIPRKIDEVDVAAMKKEINPR